MKPLLPLLLAFAWGAPSVWAELPAVSRALPSGQQPADSRLGPLRTLDDYFPFQPVASAEAWQERAAELRRRALVATGLWPQPARTPLQAVIHGRIERDGYSVEKVSFQSVPGHFVTGSLYRPAGPAPGNGRRPGVLCPHGHWANGRFHDEGEEGVRAQIAAGAEFFETGGRHPLQARCVQLARMGCVVFHYDMEGYADSIQLAHRPGVREAMNTAENWGFFSPQAELHLQNMMGLQTWNSIRALDFLLDLPDVDAQRIGVTGASGGGTQTFLLGAVDDRPSVLFPAVMVSTAMQGGCTCENAPYLRIDAGNIDLAAAAAPRPLGLTGADDWTKEIATKGGPDLQQLYALLGHPGRIRIAPFLQFGHNYNAVSRQVMYDWFNRHLGLGLPEPVQERDYQPLSPQELSVWDEAHPRPAGDQVGDTHERALVRWLTEDAREQLRALVPDRDGSPDRYREVIGGGWSVLVGRNLDDAGSIAFELVRKEERPGHLLMTGLITNSHQEQLPALFLYPRDSWNGEVVIWADLEGKAALLAADGSPIPAAADLAGRGYAVMAVDLLQTGEFLGAGDSADAARIQGYGGQTEAWQKFSGYTFGYNPPLFSRRVHDLLTAIAFIRDNPDWQAKAVHLAGMNGASPVVLAARALAGGAVQRTAVAPGGFRFASADRFDHPFFVPGAVKYHDLGGLLALCAPNPVLVLGEERRALWPAPRLYRASGNRGALEIEDAPADGAARRLAAWITGS